MLKRLIICAALAASLLPVTLNAAGVTRDYYWQRYEWRCYRTDAGRVRYAQVGYEGSTPVWITWYQYKVPYQGC